MVVSASPDAVVVEGGVNDVPQEGVSLADLTAELPLFFSALASALPGIPVYVTAPSRQGRIWTDIEAAAGAIATAASQFGHSYIDWLSPFWITGTGNAGSPTGDGNADVYVSADGIHPTAAGSAYLGTRLAFAISPPATRLPGR